jgi:cell division protein FtsW
MLPFMFLGGGVLAYKVLTNANRMARIAAFFGVKLDIGAEVVDAASERASYQAHQALVAIGNGGLFGVGLNQSMQKHYYLPEAHTDFIFAIGAEELGLGFSLVALFLFFSFFALSIYIARTATDRLGRFLVIGMTFIIFFQAMFNIGVVCEALPTKGMALPFFSYGGTNMVSTFFAVGTILSVGIRSLNDSRRTLARRVIMR